VETAFLAHTVNAWEFLEDEFFRTSGTGGTAASSVFNLGLELLRSRYDPARYNSYLFYASDGENAAEDRDPAAAALGKLIPELNYMGYVEVRPSHGGSSETEMSGILTGLKHDHPTVGIARVGGQEDIWIALRQFFQQQAGQAEAA
jgi:uncharacterized sporulation protein YeaH/YhbH (DUF444 family)